MSAACFLFTQGPGQGQCTLTPRVQHFLGRGVTAAFCSHSSFALHLPASSHSPSLSILVLKQKAPHHPKPLCGIHSTSSTLTRDRQAGAAQDLRLKAPTHVTSDGEAIKPRFLDTQLKCRNEHSRRSGPQRTYRTVCCVCTRLHWGYLWIAERTGEFTGQFPRIW